MNNWGQFFNILGRFPKLSEFLQLCLNMVLLTFGQFFMRCACLHAPTTKNPQFALSAQTYQYLHRQALRIKNQAIYILFH